jgi:hypothetical protein
MFPSALRLRCTYTSYRHRPPRRFTTRQTQTRLIPKMEKVSSPKWPYLRQPPMAAWNTPLLVFYPHQHGYAWHKKAASSSSRPSSSCCTKPHSISTISAHPPRTVASPEITYPAKSSRQGESDWSTSSSLEIRYGLRSASVPCHRLQGNGGREKTAEAYSGWKGLDQSSKPRMRVGEATLKTACWWTSRRKVRDELRSSAEQRP